MSAKVCVKVFAKLQLKDSGVCLSQRLTRVQFNKIYSIQVTSSESNAR